MGNAAPSLETQLGRRSKSRLRVLLPARLETLSGTRPVFLADVSTIGAKLNLPDEWRPSGTVVLSWLDFEAVADVVWVRGDWCGLQFDEPLPEPAIVETRAVNDSPADRVDLEARRIARDWVSGRI